jgi:hypothetical protein
MSDLKALETDGFRVEFQGKQHNFFGSLTMVVLRVCDVSQEC